jgi:hypothetical protein
MATATRNTKLYCSTIRPIIEYGCVVFYEEGSELGMKLEQIQYKAGLEIGTNSV